jgi:hypothetical protein
MDYLNPQKRTFSSSGSRMVTNLKQHLNQSPTQNSLLDKSSPTPKETSISNLNTTNTKSAKKILFKYFHP